MRSFLLVLLLLCNSVLAETKVRYALAIYSPGTNTTPASVVSGADFDLAFFAQDTRPEGTYVSPKDGTTKPLLRGVWAAYANITFDRNSVIPYLDPTGPVAVKATFSSIYANGKHGVLTSPGLIGALGAFDGMDAIGSEMQEVCRVKMKAGWPVTSHGTSTSTMIRLDLSNIQHPYYDTLVMGNTAADLPEQSDVTNDQILLSGAILNLTR